MTPGEPSIGELNVETARARMLAAVPFLRTEIIRLNTALGRTLALPVSAMRDQPPFDASAMDGWAIRTEASPGLFKIAGESAAGRPFNGDIQPDEAVRIFTGAEVPADCFVVVQEASERTAGGVRLNFAPATPRYVRRRGGDFAEDQSLIAIGERLDPWRISLAASAGRGQVTVAVKPRVAVMPTGEEIVSAGAPVRPDQIFDSAGPALAGLIELWGGSSVSVGPCGDRETAILASVQALDCDLLVTVGGASVGDHDLVKPALKRLGLELVVDTVRMRPGKPVWFGELADGRRVLGLPGNPASALVCAELFLRPLLMAWQGADPALKLSKAQLTSPLPKGGPREHWIRAKLGWDGEGRRTAEPFSDQESSLVSVFAGATGLLRHPIGAPPAKAGDLIDVLSLDRL